MTMHLISEKPRRAIVVDDDPAHRRLMVINLEEEGIEVLSLRNGKECLEQAADFDPDVILIDIHMPGLDGLETCRRLKKIPEVTTVPVVFITGSCSGDSLAVEALEAGANDFISKDASPTVLIARVRCQITINRTIHKLHVYAMTDELTGLFTRRFLGDASKRLLKSSTRHPMPSTTACLFCDLDHFKNINDTLGHVAGDEVLRVAAKTLRETTRDTDIVGRYGGEEFVVLLPNTDQQGAILTAEKIRRAIEEVSPVTMSIGIALHASAGADARHSQQGIEEAVDQLFHQADVALYASKETGRNRVTVFDESLPTQRVRTSVLSEPSQALRSA